jgi:hypothetical protein
MSFPLFKFLSTRSIARLGYIHRVFALLALGLCPGFLRAEVKPDALLQVDLNRFAMIDRIVQTVKSDVPEVQLASLRSKLLALRADHLLTASLSGTTDGVLQILVAHENNKKIGGTVLSESTDTAKSLGEQNQDLVYTPVVPCTIVDTRNAGGIVPSETVRAFDAVNVGGTFIAQGGTTSSDCAIPLGARAIATSISIFSANNNGYVTLYAQDTPLPFSVTALFNDSAKVIYNDTSAIVPLCVQNCTNDKEFVYFTAGSATHVLINVVGYFLPPNRNGDGVRITNVNGISPNIVGGAAANNTRTGVRGATIAGGGVATLGDPDYGADAPNRVTDHYGVIGGGMSNRAGNDNTDVGDAAFATVAGGRNNTAGGSASFIGGGFDNFATGFVSTVGGGEFNQSPDAWAFVGGGRFNTAAGVQSAIAGGLSNTAGGVGAFVGGGASNSAAGPRASVVGGFSNAASGQESVVLGGNNNLASGPMSLAAGRKANAPLAGCFVWGDSTDEVVDCKLTDEFVARANGGFRLITGKKPDGSPLGAFLPAGDSAWTTISDINAKTAIKKVDPQSVLSKLLRIPLVTWQYTGQKDHVRHMGPSAQDFHKAFGLGSTPLGISTADADGVALAAIQGLDQKTSADARIKDLKLNAQAKKILALEQELAAIKKKLGL